MTRIMTAALLAWCLAVAGCGGAAKPADRPADRPVQAAPAAAQASGVQWSVAPKALELAFIADPFLNEYGGAAHALAVCVYQLSDAQAFEGLAAGPSGLARLMECRPFDQSVVNVQGLTVQPGQNQPLVMDRAAKARYVAVACGYADAARGASVRLYEIPVQATGSGWLWWKQTTHAPARLARKILLGRSGIAGEGS